ncbi:MAG: DNA-directed RNA polymerase subunit omega [Ruminococcaceae bacterium]|nr:DNA-directed RNA polymerase subunit omega [Oscillospiraceae bacterium]
MIRSSIDDMLSGKESRYALVIGVAKRARQIAQKFEDEGIVTDDKPVLLAVEEFKSHKFNIIEPETDE